MTEEFVTLETAKLLKEKGMFIDIEFPPQSVAQKWIRETKNIHICVYNCACGYNETEEIRKECIMLVEQIIESKKQIGEDFTRDERVLNKLKRNEQ